MQKQRREDNMFPNEAIKNRPFTVLSPTEVYEQNSKEESEAEPQISRIDGWLVWLGIKEMAPNSPKGIQWTAPNITLMLFILGGVLYVGIWYGTVTEQNRQRDAKIEQLYQATNTAVQTAGDAKSIAITAASGNVETTPPPKGTKK